MKNYPRERGPRYSEMESLGPRFPALSGIFFFRKIEARCYPRRERGMDGRLEEWVENVMNSENPKRP